MIEVADAKHILQHLHEEKAEGCINEAVNQVAFADKILLNKIDLVNEEVIFSNLISMQLRNKEFQSFCSEFFCA